jgi:hypothetical protein
MEASEQGTMDPEGAQTSEGGVQTTTTTTTEPSGGQSPAAQKQASEVNNPELHTPPDAQPVQQGSTAQEQAQGQSSAGEQPPAEPGSDPAQGDPTFEEQQAQAAAAQSPAEPQTVPEQRPQAFTGATLVSDSSKRLDGAPAATEEDFKRANSDEAKKASIENSRTPNLVVGQRVVITEPNPEAGRMAYVLQIAYADGIQGMLANSGTPEARFAEVESYVLRTRDGRTDTLDVPPDQVKPLDDIAGWGRGQI